MNITLDNLAVPSAVKYCICDIKDNKYTIIFKPSEVKKYLGSIEKHAYLSIGIKINNPVNVITTEIDNSTKIEWCLISYNNMYYYTPKEYIDMSSFTQLNDFPVNLSSDKKDDTIVLRARTVTRNSSKKESSDSEYVRTGDFTSPSGYKLATFNRSLFDADMNVMNYPTYGAGEGNRNFMASQLAKSNVFPVQSEWYNKKYNVYFYGTSYFSEDPTDIKYLISWSSTLSGEKKFNRKYSMCYKKNASIYLLGTNKPIANSYRKGDIFYSTFEVNDEPYGHYSLQSSNGTSIVAVKPDITHMSPYAHSNDVFNEAYVGMIRNTKCDTKCKCITMDKNKLDKMNCRIRYNDMKTFVNNNSVYKWDSLYNNVGAGYNELITYNRMKIKNTSLGTSKDYWLCALPDGKARYNWYLVEDNADLQWVKLEYNYTSDDTRPGDDTKTNYDVVKDVTINDNKSTGVEATGSASKVSTSTEYNNNTEKYDEPFYDRELTSGNDEWDIPGIMKDAPEIEPEYDGWVHLHEAMDYELKENNPVATMYDDRHLRKINRFRLPVTNSGLTTKSFIFMTRPDLNLYKEENGVVDTWHMNPELIRLPTFRYIGRLKTACRSIMSSLEYYGTNEFDTPWLSVICNQATGYPIDAHNMDTVEVGKTFHGSKIVYAEPTFAHKIGGKISIPFKERTDLSLYYTLKMWMEYIQMVTLGKISPRRTHITNMELDYAVSLYFISTDITMENILYWEKLTGVFPISVPDNFFEWDEGSSGARNMNYSIDFAYSFRTIQDEMHLVEINNLYDKYRNDTSHSKAAYEAYNYSYDPSFNSIMAKVANTYYGLDSSRQLSDEEVATFTANQGNMKQFYYGNNAKGDNGYAIYAQRSNTGAIEQIKANFLPNYIPSIGMHGVPYVKGPFITREPDRAVSTNNEITGNQVDNGIYKLRWV